MHYVHRCGFCGWRRRSDSPTVLSPCCERCGCLLSATSSRELGYEPELHVAAVPVRRLNGALGRLIALAAAALLVVAVTMVGYTEGGAAIAVAALGVGGLLSIPLVFPNR